MRSRLAILAAAMLAFAGAMAVRATPPGSVNQAAILDDAMPPLLSAYNFFADAPAQQPGKGVTPYRLNTPLWSDGAEKLRFVYVPNGAQAKATSASANGGLLDLPVGSALIKTFAFTENGKRRLIETRVLLHRADGWTALPYLWNAEQTEAKLAIAGAKVPVTTPAGEAITYRVPTRTSARNATGCRAQSSRSGPRRAICRPSG